MLNFVLFPKVSRGHGIHLTVCGFCPELTDTGRWNSVRKAPIPLCWRRPRLQSALVKMTIVRGGLRALVEKPEGKISCCFLKYVTASWQALTWKLVEILEITCVYSWNKWGNRCSMKLLRGWTRKPRFPGLQATGLSTLTQLLSMGFPLLDSGVFMSENFIDHSRSSSDLY